MHVWWLNLPRTKSIERFREFKCILSSRDPERNVHRCSVADFSQVVLVALVYFVGVRRERNRDLEKLRVRRLFDRPMAEFRQRK